MTSQTIYTFIDQTVSSDSNLDSYEAFMKRYREECGAPLLVNSESSLISSCGDDTGTYKRKNKSPFTRRFRMSTTIIGHIKVEVNLCDLIQTIAKIDEREAEE